MAREPLPRIVEATLAGFLRLRFGGDWQVKWQAGRGFRSSPGRWICNLYINAIFRAGAAPEIFEVLRREFANTRVRWFRPLRSACFAGAVSRPLARFLAQAELEISPEIPGSKKWLIVTGSSKLRVIDTAAGIVYCCRKSNAVPERFRQEIEARRLGASLGLPVAPILEELSPDCIVERMIVGTPLNRLSSAPIRQRGRQLALAALRPLHDHALRIMTVAEYREDLAAQIPALVARSEYARAREKEIQHCLGSLAAALSNYGDREVTTALSHGDFQPANILWKGDGCWLIDFEFSARRQIDYDAFTYDLDARFPPGLADRILRRMRAEPGAALRLRIFLLEELLFRIQDAERFGAGAICPQWDQFMYECARASRALPDSRP